MLNYCSGYGNDYQRPEERTILSITLYVLAVLFVIGLFGTGLSWKVWSLSFTNGKNKSKNSDSLNLLESQSSQSSNALYDLDNLDVLEVIGRGRYGSVCKGILNEQTVAVKIFYSQHKQYYLNEKDVYLLPFMDHHCLPRLLGWQEKLENDGRLMEYQLVLSYAPFGCLQDYLRNHTIDWPTLCKMMLTTTQGLAYLHTEIRKGDQVKPCIAHRDLSSRNVIVKMDGSCMICDFGFAIRISGSNYYVNGTEQHAETCSLQDVGTLRYMAPEILEGAVNLRDCESSMKQIDVYALGLVLWEIASRCSDLYQGIQVPDYKQPFEYEIGSHPTFEQMQVLVTRNKARPLFPDIWKDTNPAIRSLKETIDDCWDHDAEARLTALCVEERLHELPYLWDRYKNGTYNYLGTILPPYRLNSQNLSINNQLNRLRNGSNIYNIMNYTSLSTSDNVGSEKLTNQINRAKLNDNSTSGTDETTVSITNQSEKNVQLSVNAFVDRPKLSLPLQPHQGRNPCLQRNLMIEISEDDNLLEHGLKFNDSKTKNEDMYSDNSNPSDSNALISNDILGRESRSRRIAATPIPYVQNNVGITTIPKQQNVPGNGNKSFSIEKNNDFSENNNPLIRLVNLLKLSNLTSFKKSLKKRNEKSDKNSNDESQPFTFAPNKCNDTNDIKTNLNTQLNAMISSSNITNELTEPKCTQINMVNGSPFTIIINPNDSNMKSEPTLTNMNYLPDHHNLITSNELIECSQTQVKESSLKNPFE